MRKRNEYINNITYGFPNFDTKAPSQFEVHFINTMFR